MKDTTYNTRKRYHQFVLVVSTSLVLFFWFVPYWIWAFVEYGYLPRFVMRKEWALAWGVIPIVGLLMGGIGIRNATGYYKTLHYIVVAAHLFSLIMWFWSFWIPIIVSVLKNLFVDAFSF